MRKIPFAGIELTSQRVRGYMVPLSYRGDRQAKKCADGTSSLNLLLMSYSEPARSRLLWAILSLFLPVAFWHTRVGNQCAECATSYCLPKPLLVYGSMLLLSTSILSSYSDQRKVYSGYVGVGLGIAHGTYLNARRKSATKYPTGGERSNR